ncbi:MAG: acetyl-CoA carboxylase biotin carboxylase subunit [Bacilli bacterium]|jgi:acetyl-CoA carboxylase biotin carboxylase subunit|nr:acetyl-CoA carboxylase biotin carboxylase subunit [Bacilli bacterium]
MFTKILIANRGEIALRIIRACQELNILTVAVYSICDKDSLHVKFADEAVCIGNNPSSDSYLNINNILQAAINTQAEAIHPGFGFLSENAEFARQCEQLNIKFIGPQADVINLMGDKNNARQTMIKAGVKVVPGSNGIVRNKDDAYAQAKLIGLPIIIKASAGGGGKGMRIAYELSQVKDCFEKAQLEAKKAFNSDEMYIEKYIENPRHIEVQVMGDEYHNYFHLFERECSIQRNNQKMIEEAPVENINDSTKKALYDNALKACQAVNYTNLGTVEFVMDKEENFYFIEMNTRIQVEHPITEEITGLDLIKMQILIAENKKIPFKQEDIKCNGHAIEMRINAEDPKNNFAPCPGQIKALHFPGGKGIRIDSAIFQGYTIPPYYDSMIAKVIVHGRDRDEALEKAIRSLTEIDIEGVKTNIDFQLDILLNENFLDNKYNTSFIQEMLKEDNNV